MTNNSIILLNDIILKIYTVKDAPLNLADGIGIGISEESMAIYLKEFQDYDQTRWSYATPTAKAYNR